MAENPTPPPAATKSARRVFGIVITIIGLTILIAAGVHEASQKTDGHNSFTRQEVAAIDQGIRNFHEEYGVLPYPNDPASQHDTVFDTTDKDGVGLLQILLGHEDGPVRRNPKGIKFLDVKEARRGKDGWKNGIAYDSVGKPTGLYDPWGRGYKVLLDGDGDGVVIPPADSGSTTPLHDRPSVVYSLGPDGKGGADAVRSW